MPSVKNNMSFELTTNPQRYLALTVLTSNVLKTMAFDVFFIFNKNTSLYWVFQRKATPSSISCSVKAISLNNLHKAANSLRLSCGPIHNVKNGFGYILDC